MQPTVSISQKLFSIFIRYVLPVLVISGGILYGSVQLYQSGKQAGIDSTEKKWQADLIAKMEQKELELEELRKRYLEVQRQNDLNNKQLEEQHHEKIKKLNTDIAKLRNRGLYITATACDSAGTGEAKGTGVDGETSHRVRLSEEDEGRLIQIAEDAQAVVAQYDTCRERLSQIAEIVPDSSALPWVNPPQ